MWYYFGHLQFSFHVHMMSQSQLSFVVISRIYFEAVSYLHFMAHSLREWNCKVQSEGFSPHLLYAMCLNHVKESFYPYRENQILLKHHH